MSTADLESPETWAVEGVDFVDLDQEEAGPLSVMRPHTLMGAFLAGFGGGESPVDACANTYEFVRRYGLTIEGEPFDLDVKYKHLADMYQDANPIKVAMAAAQTGKSAWVFANLARDMAGPAWGKMLGYYFPDAHLPVAFARDRFKPFLRSNPELGQLLGAEQKQRGGKGVNNTLTMTWGECTAFFLTIKGKTATEGLPLKGTYYDEVRRMELGDIERAMERYSAQPNPIDVKVSTAGYPETDIHHWFLKSDQRYFHTACGCADGVVLSLTWPDCVLDLTRATPKLLKKVAHAYSHAGIPYLGMDERQAVEFMHATYYCPKCGEIITDPRMGWWEPHNPGAFAHGYQMPQCLSWTYPAGRLWQKFQEMTDQGEFMKSGLGLPHVDKDKMPVQDEHLWACVDDELPWGEDLTHAQRQRRLRNCTMGVDVQAGYLCAVLKCPHPTGRHRTVHVEVVHHESNPWIRLGELMSRYDVRMAIIDYAPEFTAAMQFAKAFKGRVWLQQYSLSDKAPRHVAWEEDALGRDRKQKGDTSFRYWVAMKRTAILHWSCTRWTQRANIVPHPRKLVQRVPVQNDRAHLTAHLRAGTMMPWPIGVDPYFDHQKRWVFRDILEDAETDKEKRMRLGKSQQVAEWVGQDPHFSHADAWASLALTRITGRARVRSAGGR